MKLIDLIHDHHWLSIRQILYKIDHDLKQYDSVYQQVFETLQGLTPMQSNIILLIDRHWEDDEPTEHAQVYGYDPTIKESEPTPYLALEWTSWHKWLGFQIDQDAIDEWTELQIICHSMIEMTIDGFTQKEVQETSGQMLSNMNVIKTKYFKDKLDNK